MNHYSFVLVYKLLFLYNYLKSKYGWMLISVFHFSEAPFDPSRIGDATPARRPSTSSPVVGFDKIPNEEDLPGPH